MTTRRDAAYGATRRVALILVLALVVGAVWATVRGYVPPIWEGWGCSDVAYPSPQPAFEELVNEYGESPYCARRIRGEEWF